jgi:hypothetical protein
MEISVGYSIQPIANILPVCTRSADYCGCSNEKSLLVTQWYITLMTTSICVQERRWNIYVKVKFKINFSGRAD